MKMNDLVQLLMQHADEYSVESVEKIPIGVEPVKKHHKRRIQKKWIKRYGMKTIYEEKKCKKISVTPGMIVDFCNKYNLPLPDEMLNIEYNKE